ncbi:sodium:proton antiporter [Chroococcus sp. FPU101]|uniref:cation:proton antiporter n=1 Tax=Chroococcus sp. FPU101 TaxID=1974212 RepID=UPI001A8F8D4E|nr:sodium:proton antiporter [Chroococcus sp. FPU101]
MDNYILILLVVGSLLLFVTLGSGWISRLPLSYALIYLIIGIILGPYGIQLIKIRPDADFLERLTEFVVIVSLFSCGLKMNRPLNTLAWNSTIRLIGFLMPISIFGLALFEQWILGVDFGTALLLGAILAPTDPVLASEVQIKDPEDGDELRFGLTSEGGLNDALAFPFVYFGLYWLKDENWQNWFKNWVAVDLIWASFAGIVMGYLVAKVVVWLDQRLQQSNIDLMDELMEDFIALSIILLTYSLTELVNGYGFLAVFVAGIVTQGSYRDPEKPYAQLEFIERFEKLLEIGTILLLGALLRFEPILFYLPQSLMIAGLLFFVIRPLGSWISTIGDRFVIRRWLFGWFGIRGVGSLYYLFYAFGKGLKGELGEQIAWITLTVIALSVIIHGITTTPIMNWYERQIEKRQRKVQSVKL